MPSIREIDPFASPVTRSMVDALQRAAVHPANVAGAIRTVGWSESVSEEWPSVDRARPLESFTRRIAVIDGIDVPAGCRLQCRNYFPDRGGMDWHTDSAQPGWRIYVYRYAAGGGVFRYCRQRFDEYLTGAYVFQTGVDCWHSVVTNGERYSCGLEIPESLARELE